MDRGPEHTSKGHQPYRSAPIVPADGPLVSVKRPVPRHLIVTLSMGGALLVLLALSLQLWGFALYGVTFAAPIVLLFALRQKTEIYQTHIVQGRVFQTIFMLAETRHVFQNNGAVDSSLAQTAVFSYSLDEIILISERGQQVSLSTDIPHTIRSDVVATALGAAVSKAESQIAAGGAYSDPDDLHGIDGTRLYGFRVGLIRTRHACLLDDIRRIEDVGVGLLAVYQQGAEGVAFVLGSRDVVLRQLLQRRDLF